jgi:hypothetical protein
MLGFIATVGVVAQMALLSNQADMRITLSVGLFACAAWIAHAVKQKDRSLLATNVIVAGFAVWGLIN